MTSSAGEGGEGCEPRTLSQLDEEQRYSEYDRLQARMPDVWALMRREVQDESVVVVPSMSLGGSSSPSGTANQAMEERSLFLTLLLRQPQLRMIYVTSMPITESIVEYYLGLLPGVIPSHARRRLTLLSVNDSTPRPLSAKLLEHPRLLRQVRRLIPDLTRSHLIGYNVTALERDVAISLGIPIYGPDPRLAPLGSKTGCRRLFEEVGIAHPLGAEDLHGFDEVTDALLAMRERRPAMSAAVVKLNEGVSGAGNAIVNLRGLPDPGSPQERAAVEARVAAMELEAVNLPRHQYAEAFSAQGGIVEELITGVRLLSPSVQLRVRPDRSVELLSTHDQLLGGSSGQSYLGCVFPADPAYSELISAPALTVAERLAELGVLGRFAVDFVVAQDDTGAWSAYAIELNLRKGGTTHPFLTLQFLVGGSYDLREGVFRDRHGEPKYLVATDHCEAPELRALRHDDLFDIVVRHGLHFDQRRQTGVVLHMISCLTELGRVGFTAVGDSPDQAWKLYERAGEVLMQEAVAASTDWPVLG